MRHGRAAEHEAHRPLEQRRFGQAELVRHGTKTLLSLFTDPSTKVSVAAFHAANLGQKAAARLSCKTTQNAHSRMLQAVGVSSFGYWVSSLDIGADFGY